MADLEGEVRDHEMRLAGGRVLRARDGGARGGRPVVLLHDGLGSRLVPGPVLAAAAQAGLRLLSFDRPGFGGSTPRPGRTVADVAADVAAVADRLGVDRFAVWGRSDGGPFALACTALLPDRVTAAAVVAPLAPHGAPGAMAQLAEALAATDLAGASSPQACACRSACGPGGRTPTPRRATRSGSDAIPGAELRWFPDEGHLSLIYGRHREVIDWLASQAESRSNGGPQ